MSDKLLIIVLAGWSCSGKSTIAKKLANIYEFHLIELYDVYHELAIKKGYNRSREWLKEVGNDEFVTKTVFEIIDIIKLRRRYGSKGFIIDASLGEGMDFSLDYFLRDVISAENDVNIVNIPIFSPYYLRLHRMEIRLNTLCTKDAIKELLFRDRFLRAVNLDYVIRKANFSVWNISTLEKVVEEIRQKLSAFKIISYY